MAVPPTLLEAFENTAKALQQFGIPRVRVVGLSESCTMDDYSREKAAKAKTSSGSTDDIDTVTEQEFMHKFVFHSRPCIIVDAIDSWPALQRWRDDRYVFDLDHQLPSEEEWTEDEDEEEEEEENAKEGVVEEPKDTNLAAEASQPRRRGPKKITVALTPNGRADAVTHVVYSTADVSAEDAAAVYVGAEAAKQAIVLSTASPSSATGQPDGETATIRTEKIFMYAAEKRVTLPQFYTMLQNSPTIPLPDPTHVDMQTFKEHGETGGHADGASTSPSSSSLPVPAVAYAQLQNNCLNTEYRHLHVDLRDNIAQFGCRIFNTPEVAAANVWFGIAASVSSMHQDWVENLYSVVRGVKEFVLIPPWEGLLIPKPEIPAAAFQLEDDPAATDGDVLPPTRFKPYPLKDGTLVPWMDIEISAEVVEADGGTAAVQAALQDSIRKNGELHPRTVSAAMRDAASHNSLHPLVARVHPGETLYLPAMWLHRVAQRADEDDIRRRAHHHQSAAAEKKLEGSTAVEATKPATAAPLPLIAAVNYWFDMSYENPSVVLLREFGLLL